MVTGLHSSGGTSALAVARLNSNGTLDTTFGSGGAETTSLPGQGSAVAIQPDGKIVVAGELETPGSSTVELVVARFLSQ